MNILYIAFACNPYTGSEAYCGWSTVYEMSKLAKVTVITRKENEKSICEFLKKSSCDIEFIYCDIPDSLNFYYKTRKHYYLYYCIWVKYVGHKLKAIISKNKYDVIHHITLGDLRVLCKMDVKNAITVFGPVGGAQITPKVFKQYVIRNFWGEKVREILNVLICNSFIYKKKITKTDIIYAANEETHYFLRNVTGNNKKINLLTENGVQKSSSRNTTYNSYNSSPVIFLWSGRMVLRKGLDFLLEVLSILPENICYELYLVGDGPEKQRLEEKSKLLKLTKNVKFYGKISYDEMQKLYDSADVFVFPSYRETTGTVLFEAMRHGLPIISFKQNGAKLVVNKESGILIEVNDDINVIKKEFAEAIILLSTEHDKRRKMGLTGREWVIENYSWDNKAKKIYNDYLDCV